jgi:hypothetical protein
VWTQYVDVQHLIYWQGLIFWQGRRVCDALFALKDGQQERDRDKDGKKKDEGDLTSWHKVFHEAGREYQILL